VPLPRASWNDRFGVTFTFTLERPDGKPADPPRAVLGVYSWNRSDTITLGAGRSLRVVDVRDQSDDESTVLVVEDMSQ
jgi:hypothetical protein